MGLRLCMFQRRRSYGLMFAPAAVWTYVSIYRSAWSHMDLRVCRFRCGCGLSFVHIEVSAAGEADSAFYVRLEFRAHLAQR